ncbi:MAG TPA: hypothetical protein VHE83_10310 [Mycobacteriales bacterium]|nr:hypothetical protein [Mycobacteriales bacterium]
MSLVINGNEIPTTPVNDFLAEKGRASSFITNYGDWTVSPAIAAGIGADVAHLEWFHDTGELVLVGAVPQPGEGTIEIGDGDATTVVAQELLTPGGAPGHADNDEDGVTRERFPENVVPVDTLMAVLAVVDRSEARALLRGWRREHRKDDGWAWLEARLAQA